MYTLSDFDSSDYFVNKVSEVARMSKDIIEKHNFCDSVRIAW